MRFDLCGLLGLSLFLVPTVLGCRDDYRRFVGLDDEGSATNPRIAVDSSGRAVAVWKQYEGSGFNIWANSFRRDTGWASAKLLETGDGSAHDPDVSVGPGGQAMAVWTQLDATERSNIWATYFTPEGGWRNTELIEDHDGGGNKPDVAVDADGNAIVVWSEHDGTHFSVWVNRFTPGTGWEGAEPLETEEEDAFGPDVAVTPNGMAIVAWLQLGSDPTEDLYYSELWVRHFTPETGWGSAERLDNQDGEALDSGIALNSRGDAVVAWARVGEERRNAWANRFTPGTGWSDAEPLEDNDGITNGPNVAVDPRGNAVVIWSQTVGGDEPNAWTNRFTPDTGWGSAELLEGLEGGAWEPSIAMDSNGNALAVWYQREHALELLHREGNFLDIWVNSFTPEGGWGDAERIDSGDGDAARPQIAMDPSGNGLAVWHQSDGNRFSIRANRFTPATGWGSAEVIDEAP